MSQDYRFGIEEEFFVVDADTNTVQRRMPAGFFDQLKLALGDAVTVELLQSQLEIATEPATWTGGALEDLRDLRGRAARVAAEHGLGFIAAGTHPTATWDGVRHTQANRYDSLMEDLQMLGERNMVCGLHVHVQLPDPDQRVDVMRRILPYIPHFIALATSSPFWGAKQTGLMGYRLAAYDELPRTGLPELFEDNAAYQAYVQALVAAGAIADSSYVWWAIRPSSKHPTLELRAPDSCTRVEDTVAIAALYRSLVRFLVRNPDHNRQVGAVDRAIANENKWRAQRYGVHGSFVDRVQQRAVGVPDAVEALIALVSDDAHALGALDALLHLRTIATDGTSADMQLAIYDEAQHRTGNRGEALNAVKTWLAETTLQ
ncbi:carboxylate-amine ligase [Aquabacter spiritensis]|uniref:Putative glutamate--cysteine ligase 2 n=1 Tax=Aquabacter spiritensis TaxID=933073 RepID=A0A4R3LQE2_9HYPH|nr:carboxylate-amine ligase [Aquabacter spiritensis]TCT02600.1 carboxylate-amine ligase [Aquabacter spiritensis]